MKPIAGFDFDGVCRDESRSYQRCKRETVTHFDPSRRSPTSQEMAGSMAHSNNDWVGTQWILEGRGVYRDLDTITEHFQDLYLGKERDFSGYIQNEPWLVDIKLLAELAKKFHIVVISSAPKEEIKYAARKNEAIDYIDLILGMGDCEGKADGAEQVLRKFGAETMWFCDDREPSLRDVASNPNVKPYGILPPRYQDGLAEKLKRAGAVDVFNDVNEYIKFLSAIKK
ncbi:HAD family hydrolase [Nanoarchaeota archaeon]